jgi:hypothetical protein
MGKQYKSLKESDIEFIQQQKLFYIASCSSKEVNLSPKGYESIKVKDANTMIFIDYPGSANRTYRDSVSGGKFTLLFNAFDDKALILRLFCKSNVVQKDSLNYQEYLKMFDIKESIVRNIFEFNIYVVESSCGMSVPVMKYQQDRDELKEWAVDMDKRGKLKEYNQKKSVPVDLRVFSD